MPGSSCLASHVAAWSFPLPYFSAPCSSAPTTAPLPQLALMVQGALSREVRWDGWAARLGRWLLDGRDSGPLGK